MHMNDFVELNTKTWTSRTQSVPLFKFKDDDLQKIENFTRTLTIWFDCKQHFFWRIIEGSTPKCIETKQDLLNNVEEIKNELERQREELIRSIKTILKDAYTLDYCYIYYNPVSELAIITKAILDLSHAQEKALMLLQTTQITHLPKPKLEI